MTSAEYQEAIQFIQYVWQKRQSGQLRTFKSHPWQEAIDKFDRARSLSTIYDDDPIKEQEQRAKYHYQRGYAYLCVNMLDKAVEDFTVGRKLAPNDLQLAQAYSYVLSIQRQEKDRQGL
jgi:tetratricopeptide (TPR) repeat protein